jgi:hypothetical protein
LADLDGDGLDDAVIGSDAMANGRQLPNGSDDSHCYLYAISGKGLLLWQAEIGDTFVRSYPFVVQSPAGQKPRLYAWITAHPEVRGPRGELGKVVEFDFRGNRLSQYDAGAYLACCLTDDLNSDRRSKILATDRLGCLHVLDLDLKPVHRIQVTQNAFTSVDLQLVAVTNVIGRTGKQLVFASSQVEHRAGHNVGNTLTEVNVHFVHNSCVQVWDSSLRLLSTHVLENKLKEAPQRTYHVADWDHDGIQEIIVLDRTVKVLKYSSCRF